MELRIVKHEISSASRFSARKRLFNNKVQTKGRVTRTARSNTPYIKEINRRPPLDFKILANN